MRLRLWLEQTVVGGIGDGQMSAVHILLSFGYLDGNIDKVLWSQRDLSRIENIKLETSETDGMRAKRLNEVIECGKER